MNHLSRYFLFLTILCSPVFSEAATIMLKTEKVVCKTPEVTLGDIAVITASQGENIEILKNVQICLAPLPTVERKLSYTQVRDILGRQGIPFGKHVFTGAAQVVIVANSVLSRNPEQNLAENNPVEKVIEEAIIIYLKQRISSEAPWKVVVQIEPQHKPLIAECGKLQAVRGGTAPYTGTQHFELQYSEIDKRTGQNIVVGLDVEISLPPMVVVAKQAMSRGTIVSPSDVTLGFLEKEMDTNTIVSLENVIGRELIQTIRQGTVLTTSQIQDRTLIKRNEVVTVYVRNQGITVKTVGRTRHDGRLNELIIVESLQDKKTFTGRVTDIGTVEVDATSVVVIPGSEIRNNSIQQVNGPQNANDNSTFLKLTSK